MVEKKVPGCSYLSFGECLNTHIPAPSSSKESNVDSSAVLEGPPAVVKARVCGVSGNCKLQEKCDGFKFRTEADNERDLNI